MGREPPGRGAGATVAVDLHRAMWAAWGVGLVRLLVVDPAAVDEVLGPWASLFEERGLPGDDAAPLLTEEIEALVALGRLDRAERLAAAVAAAVVAPDRRLRVALLRCRALLSAAQGDLEGAADLAATAVAQGSLLGAGVELGRTYLAAGRIARRRKQKHLARQQLERAVAMFAGPQWRPLREAARAELARLGDVSDRGHAAGPARPLTPTELQVAALSASGMRNRDVAHRLGISPKTVEVNLSRIYRKLGIHSRAELGARHSPDRPEAGPGRPAWGNP